MELKPVVGKWYQGMLYSLETKQEVLNIMMTYRIGDWTGCLEHNEAIEDEDKVHLMWDLFKDDLIALLDGYNVYFPVMFKEGKSGMMIDKIGRITVGE